MDLKNKNVLITGGHGFIGFNLALYLEKKGVNVITVDLPSKQQIYNSFFKTYFLDCNDFEIMKNLIQRENIEFIFHLAAQPLVQVAYKNPKYTIYNNINTTLNILELVREKYVKGALITSSDKAYGPLLDTKYDETHRLAGKAPYDVSKSCADLLCQSYISTYNCPIIITRFSNVFGPRDFNFGRIIPDIMKATLNNEELVLRSNGKMVREYTYVKDICEACSFLVENFEKTKGNSYNIGSGTIKNVLDIIKIIEKLLGKKIKLKIENNPIKNEIPFQQLDSSKIYNLGWEPQYDFKTAIEETYEWYKITLFPNV